MSHIKPEQLSQSLKQPLLSYWLTGDEPLLMDEARQSVVEAYRRLGLDEHLRFGVDASFDWGQIIELMQGMSLFSSRQLIELRFHKAPSSKDHDFLSRLFELCSDDNRLLLISPALKKNQLDAKWTQGFHKLGAVLQFWPLDVRQFPNWLKQRAQQFGFSLDPAGLDFLASSTQGNLLAAQQELMKLQLLLPSGRVTLDELVACVADSSRYSAQDMMDAALVGDLALALDVMHHLQADGLAKVLWVWTINHDCNVLTHLWRCRQTNQRPNPGLKPNFKREANFNRALTRVNEKKLDDLLLACSQLDRISKGCDPKQMDFSLAMMQFLQRLSQ